MQIHETAFIVSTYRSYHEDISNDIYAKLWNNPKTEALIPTILAQISESEPILHSLRNRFFYEQMKTFFELHKGGTFINFGAGFSMYQFQMNENVHTIEIDKPEIIAYKKEKVDSWIDQSILPNREIEYIAIDFNQRTEAEIIKTLCPMIKKEPTFILVEGVLFFLDLPTTNKLFRVFKQLQSKGDIIGSVSYLPAIESTAIYKRLLHYFNLNNTTNDSFNYQTLPISYYQNVDEYLLKINTDESLLAKIYAKNSIIGSDNEILNEHMYLLEKH